MIIPLTAAAIVLTALQCTEAFNHPMKHNSAMKRIGAQQGVRINGLTKLRLSQDQETQPQQPNQSQKLARLNAMATKLRAEATALEAEQQVVVNSKLSQTFALLDTNQDGSISLQELKHALSTQLEAVVSEEQALKIMSRFDTDGNGSIQLDEFKGIKMFKLTLDKVLREEKQAGIDANSQAVQAKQAAEIAAAKVIAVTDQVNSLPPTGSDKILSLIPYLLPLCDALPYAKAFITSNGLENNNPIFDFASFFFLLYQSVPFSGLIAYILFNSISSNLKLNRLVRFNIQQAIFLDIALIFPGLFGGIIGAIAQQGSIQLPSALIDAGSTATFLSLSAAILYSMGSSLGGVLPDKIPYISDRVKVRVPTAEDILKLIEDQEDMMQMMEQERKAGGKRRERVEKKGDEEENKE